MEKVTKIFKSSTAYVIYNPGIQLYDLIDAFSTIVYKEETKKPLAYIYDSENDVVRVPAGVGDRYINDLFPGKPIELLKYSPFHKSEFEMISKPDQDQKAVLGDIISTLKKDSQVKCTLPTGTGKTFTATFLAHILKMKVLVLVGTDNLRQQWHASFMKHSSLKHHEVVMLSGGRDFAYNYPNGKIFITTHSTIRGIFNISDPLSCRKFNEWLANNGVGLKIFDEADLETANMFKIDLMTNVCRTLYLTATDYKSSKFDDRAYQKAFQVTKAYGEERFEGRVANRSGYIVLWNSKPGKTLYTRAMSFSNDFSPVKYCEYMFIYRQDIMMDLIDKAYKLWKEVAIPKYNPNARMLITVSRKAYCFILRDMLMKRYGLTLKDIGVYNSSVDPKWKDFEFKKPFVISTLKSFGRGVDSPDMDVHCDLEKYISESQFQQAVGRTGRKGGSKGFYLTHFDMAYTFVQISYKKKKELFKKLFATHKVIDLDEKFEPLDRPEAVKMKKEFQLKWWKYLKAENEERMTAKKKYGGKE